MINKNLSVSCRTRATPFTRRVESSGVSAYTVYNHMLLPTVFDNLEDDYWSLCNDVQVWDVSCERQIQISGPDSQRLVQLMTPRDISVAKIGQGLYAPLCDENGGLLNDPVLIKAADDQWFVSIADSDIALWAKGLATGFGLKVSIEEAQIWPLAVQGPKAETLMKRVFGDQVSQIRFFQSELLEFHNQPMRVMRSGYSRQGGFEIYLNDPTLAEPLWDTLFEQGKDLGVKAGGPNLIERIESSLISYGNEVTIANNPFECGLDAFIDLDAAIESISLPALRELAGNPQNQLKGLCFEQPMEFDDLDLTADGELIGDIRSQIWSPRFQKHLAMAMIRSDYLEANNSLHAMGKRAKIVDLPFDFSDSR